MHSNKTFTFLFGSGISIPAGMAPMSQITERILSGSEMMRHTDGFYYRRHPSIHGPDENVLRVTSFLKIIANEINRVYAKRRRSTNYEDIFFAVSQLHDNEIDEYENPALVPFRDRVMRKFLKTGRFQKSDKVWEITLEAQRYIVGVVVDELSKSATSLNHLGFLLDAFQDSDLEKIDLFTLNHDQLLEKYLAQNKIAVVDGFDQANGDLRFWRPELYSAVNTRLRLFKLHGSLKWYIYEPENLNGKFQVAALVGNDSEHPSDTSGETFRKVDGPLVLAGTFNKLFDYSRHIWFELQCQFHQALNHSDRLVVCGYGFGDKGINSKIIDWIDAQPARKMLIAHPTPAQLKLAARPAIGRSWTRLESAGKVTVVSKGVEHLSWTEIKTALQ